MVLNNTYKYGFENDKFVFNYVDYLVFCGMLSISIFIGIYHGVKPKKKEQTVDDYMLGGRKMPMLPVAVSLAASFLSGITLLGIPAETYMYGTQLNNICITVGMCYFLMKYFYLPIIYEAQFNSLFEYLEKRFDKTVRLMASLVFAVSLLLIIPVVIYVPALAFNQVTGLSIYVLAPIICSVCIFYTSLGGLKAVVWSDALQGGSTLFALIVVILLGLKSVGGLKKVFEIANRGERLEMFNLDPDPFARNTFWTTTFGSLPTWLMAFAAHPSTAQRYISLSTYKQAQVAVLIMVIGIIIIKSLSAFTGLIIYAKYHDCDPVANNQVKKSGQILPYYIMDVSQDYPGLAGLFLSGVVCTALSTMSTALNTVAGTIYEDFLKSKLLWNQTDRVANLTIQTITVFLGVLTTVLVFLVEKLGTIMQVAVSFQGVTNGVSLFMFTFGMFVPWGNSVGIKAGTVAGLAATTWLVTGAQIYTQSGHIEFPSKIRSIENCYPNITMESSSNLTLGFSGTGTKVLYSDYVPTVYRLSYLYYSLVGFSVGMIVASLVSKFTNPQDASKLDQKLIIPQLRKHFKTVNEKPSHEMYVTVSTKEDE